MNLQAQILHLVSAYDPLSLSEWLGGKAGGLSPWLDGLLVQYTV